MARITVDVDTALLDAAMAQLSEPDPTSAVTKEEVLGMRGSGFDLTNEQIEGTEPID